MAVLGYILIFVLYGWIVTSPFVWLYWHFRPESHSTNKAIAVVGIGTILGIGVLLLPGFESALFFIPSSWSVRSGPEVWERDSLRDSLAGFLSFLCSLGFLAILDNGKQLRLENRDLKRLLDEKNEIDQ